MTEELLLIHSYSRAEALADGVLIDVTEAARDAGFRVPVALTCGAWGACVSVPEGERDFGPSEAGRLRDVLDLLHLAIEEDDGGTRRRFGVRVRDGSGEVAVVKLVAACGPNDDASPCVTVMLPGED